MRRILLLTAFSLLFSAFRTNAPLTLPKEPVSPGVEAPAGPSATDVGLRAPAPKGEPFPASVVFSDGTTNSCVLYLPAKEMTFYFDRNGSPYRNSFPISSISSVEFLRWKGYCQDDKTTWIFYPVRTRMTTRDGLTFDCTYYIEEFGRTDSADKFGKTTLYSYFYEYRVKDLWQNCKKKDKTWPEAHPPAKVVKRIIFRAP